MQKSKSERPARPNPHPPRPANMCAKRSRNVREGKHGARNAKQALAIGLSKARKAGVRLPPQPGRKAPAASAGRKPNPKRSQATLHALKREGSAAASHEALPAIRAKVPALTAPRRDSVQCVRLKSWTARSCFSAASRVPNVPRLRRLPVLASAFLEYSRYSPLFSFRIILGLLQVGGHERTRIQTSSQRPRTRASSSGGTRLGPPARRAEKGAGSEKHARPAPSGC